MCWRVVVLLMAALSFSAQAQAPSNVQNFYPLLLDGTFGGSQYRTTLKMMSTDPSHPLVQCVLTQRQTNAPFLGINGDFYAADVFDAGDNPPAMTTIVLDRYLPWEILQSTGSSGLKSGYAVLVCSGTIQADLQVALFDTKGTKTGETSIAPATEARSFEFLLDTRNGMRLAFFLTNDSALEGDYMVIARDEFNQEIDLATDTIGRWSQVARFVEDMLKLPTNFVGSVEIVGLASGHNYVAGMQFTGSVFTAVSPISRNQPLGF